MINREPSTYGEAEPLYRVKNGVVVAVLGKKPQGKGWANRSPSEAEIAERHRRHGRSAFGLLSGTDAGNNSQLGFIDVDHNAAVAFVRAFLGGGAVEKVGSKGGTFFVRFDRTSKSSRIKRKETTQPIVEIMANTGMTVLPNSPHPSGGNYRWVGRSLLEVDFAELPFVSRETIDTIKAVLENEHAWAVIDGGANVAGHSPMLALTASGIAKMTDDLPHLAGALGDLFHPNYAGNTKGEILGMLESARAKNLGRRKVRPYDPGEIGPRPLGFTPEGLYALLDPVRQIIVLYSAQQLLSTQCLMGLAPSGFWHERFPAEKSIFNATGAGEALIAAARTKGPFRPQKVRGRGIWREGERIVINFGDQIDSKHFLYLCFEPIPLALGSAFDTARLMTLLEAFSWRGAQDAILLLGWLAFAPICGALNWRPHAFVYGPPRSGKTTLHYLAGALLGPLAIKADGQSSEAGIRQSLGPDSLPVMLDEFESDQRGNQLKAVLRLARSASSADTPVLRGTPEGRAMQFSLRTTFFFAAINPRGMSPADQSRIIMLELLMHDNDSAKAKFILSEELYFRSQGEDWCSYMIGLAGDVVKAIDLLEPLMPSGDRRHRQNIATLLGAAFVALHGRIPEAEEAESFAHEYGPAVERHALEIERDDAQECLDHLFAHAFDRNTLGMWIPRALADSLVPLARSDAIHVLGMFDMQLHDKDGRSGLLIRNNSPAIEKIFKDTRWADGAWQRALRKLPGAFSLKDPVQFRSSGVKSRVIGIPMSYVADRVTLRENP
ncbi:bifunctional DNA primase/polymerase [Bosea sp. NBC_00550]|uniref:bifunctional DNA primase/polymerase n=1 Tax=Bosea sp. NBC_00550 TaxID=2969621 RepID=UPI0022301801|nr:bifunctional DNA primase/polymerase [Bosea sp. NBC_00550]UZF90884.1 bifunctional DNA primase/polymerase [Bosea sp. NBC_00550]